MGNHVVLDNHSWFDTVRGAPKGLHPNRADAEFNDPSTLTGFTSDGWTMAGHAVTNANNQNYVGWAWDAGANSNKTYTVKVVSDSGNKYRFDDHGTSAVTLDLAEGSTYIFDQSDSSNSATHCGSLLHLMERTVEAVNIQQG